MTQLSIFSKMVKYATHAALRSSSTARPRSTVLIAGRHTRLQKTNPRPDHSPMMFDNVEENEPCEFCGMPVQFFDDDWMRCTGCGAEYSNMDYTGDQIIEDWE